MKKIILALLALLACSFVAGAADISIRQIRDPVQFQSWIADNISDVSGVATNIAGASIVSGNIVQARITNALASAGQYVLGNIPVASITNAASSLGASIGGNIPSAALTNAIDSIALVPNAASYTNVIISKNDKTNTIIVIEGQVSSWVVTQ